jgi:5-methylcytosine-specific restriction protein A
MATIKTKSISPVTKPKNEIGVDTGRKNAQSVYNTRMWQNFRKSYLMEHPVCENCNKNLSEDVHHIIPIPRYADPLTVKTVGFDPGNLRCLCRECHRKQHNARLFSDRNKIQTPL